MTWPVSQSITEFLPNIGKVNTGPAFLGKLSTLSRKRAMYDLDTFRFEKFSASHVSVARWAFRDFKEYLMTRAKVIWKEIKARTEWH